MATGATVVIVSIEDARINTVSITHYKAVNTVADTVDARAIGVATAVATLMCSLRALCYYGYTFAINTVELAAVTTFATAVQERGLTDTLEDLVIL